MTFYAFLSKGSGTTIKTSNYTRPGSCKKSTLPQATVTSPGPCYLGCCLGLPNSNYLHHNSVILCKIETLSNLKLKTLEKLIFCNFLYTIYQVWQTEAETTNCQVFVLPRNMVKIVTFRYLTDRNDWVYHNKFCLDSIW